MEKRSLADWREKVMDAVVARAPRPGSSPGMKAKSRLRISKPPPVGGETPVLMATVLPLRVVTLSAVRLASGVSATGAGSHASAGTVALVLMARSSAQSLAKAIA